MEDLDRRRGAPGHLSDEVLTAYLDEAPDLTPAARASVEAHLAGCGACRAALRDLGTTVALLRDLPQLAPRRSFALTPDLVEGAAGPGREPVRPGSRRFAWVWPVRWASALATLLFAIVVGLDAGGPAAAPPPTATQVVAVATSTPSPGVPPSSIDDPMFPVGAFGLTPTIFPSPTPVAVAPPPAPAPIARATDYRVAEVGLGGLALVLGAAGFLAPPFLRRRAVAA
jgi:hypothetical protein